MHYHLEIIMPPTEDVKRSVAEILKPFDENAESRNHDFWDWYQLGGRYSGSKLDALVPQEKRDAFFAELKNKGVTVSGLQFGKQELSPSSQIPMVDALWREMCPGGGDVCPLFQHSGKSMTMDICKLRDLPKNLTAYRVIIAALGYEEKAYEAAYMRTKDIWNGVTHESTTFDGNVQTALSEWQEKSKNYRAEYIEKRMPTPDWLCVTVDYHS